MKVCCPSGGGVDKDSRNQQHSYSDLCFYFYEQSAPKSTPAFPAISKTVVVEPRLVLVAGILTFLFLVFVCSFVHPLNFELDIFRTGRVALPATSPELVSTPQAALHRGRPARQEGRRAGVRMRGVAIDLLPGPFFLGRVSVRGESNGTVMKWKRLNTVRVVKINLKNFPIHH